MPRGGRAREGVLSGSPRWFIHPSRPADRSVRRKWSATAALHSTACSIYLFCAQPHSPDLMPLSSFLSLLSSSPPIPYAVHVCMYVYVRPFLMRLVLFSEGEIENQFPVEMLAVQRTARGIGYLSRAGLWLVESARNPNFHASFSQNQQKNVEKISCP